LTEPDDLRARIENAKRNVKEDYERTLETVVTLKEKMNELEQRISQKKPEEAKEDLNSLRYAIESLDRLTDSQILKSKEAWKKYRELEHNCKTQTLESTQLNELQKLCEKTEQVAADLLCYSLGLLKRKNL
jgi:hypothetical protein